MNSIINKHFIKDLKMPIAVHLDPYFSYFLNLIDPYYNSINKYWNSDKGWVDIECAQKYSKYHIQHKLFPVEGIFIKI